MMSGGGVMNAEERARVTVAESRAGRAIDVVVAGNVLTVGAAIAAAIVPARVATQNGRAITDLQKIEVAGANGETQVAQAGFATADVDGIASGGSTLTDVALSDISSVDPLLRDSVSAYWDLGTIFWVPFGLAALLMVGDGALSFFSKNRAVHGNLWFNVVLGLALAGLTTFNTTEYKAAHFTFAAIFFVLFLIVMGYTARLGRKGRRLVVHPDDPADIERATVDRAVERFFGTVTLLLLLAALASLVSWQLGIITFYFFELHALITFAVFFALLFLHPFPYRLYEFPNDRVNEFLRSWAGLKVMAPRPPGAVPLPD